MGPRERHPVQPVAGVHRGLCPPPWPLQQVLLSEVLGAQRGRLGLPRRSAGLGVQGPGCAQRKEGRDSHPKWAPKPSQQCPPTPGLGPSAF